MIYKRILGCMALMAGCGLLSACQDANGRLSDADFDEEKEKAAIMKVIQEETECFFSRNYDCWAEQFTHTDYSYQAWSNADGTFDASVGWEAIEKNLGKYIKENPLEEEEAGNSHPVVIRKNVKVKFYGDQAAHLTWDQYNSSRNQEYFLHSKEVRLMEKPKGSHWKIVNVSAFWDYVNKIPFEEMKPE